MVKNIKEWFGKNFSKVKFYDKVLSKNKNKYEVK